MSALWPFPVDPEQVFAARDEVRAIRDAALREVGIVKASTGARGGGTWGGDQWDEVMRAQRIAFISLGIDFDDVDRDEYRSRFSTLPHAGERPGIIGKSAWQIEVNA